MGWRHILLVRDLAAGIVGTSARLVLYAIAARADDGGNCYPSVAQIMADTGLARASVFRALEECRAKGLVVTVSGKGKGGVNRYALPVHNSGGVSHSETGGVSHSETGGVSQRDGGCLTVRRGVSHSETRKSTMKKTSKLVCIAGGAVHNSEAVHNSGGDVAASGPAHTAGMGVCDAGAGMDGDDPIAGMDGDDPIAGMDGDDPIAGIDGDDPMAGSGGCDTGAGMGHELDDRPWNVPGWVPCGIDRDRVLRAAFDYGLASQEATAFWRWNATRRWTAVSAEAGVSVADLIRQWGEKWCRREGADMLGWERARRRAVTVRK